MSETDESKQVCVIGLDNMGSALAEASINAGHDQKEIAAIFEVLVGGDA